VLLSDAAHVYADAGGIGLSLFAVWMARRPATPRRSYGYYRIEILAALLNGAILLALSVFILYEAVQRWQNPPAVEGGLMMAVVAFGLAANLAGAFVLFKSSRESLNVKAAFNEVASDALGAGGALVGGLIIYLAGYLRTDAIVSGMIALLIFLFAIQTILRGLAVANVIPSLSFGPVMLW
jgi:cobalt-zinc-cadmium efflux system protein